MGNIKRREKTTVEGGDVFNFHHLSDTYKFLKACNAQLERQLRGLGLRQIHKEETTYPYLCLAK